MARVVDHLSDAELERRFVDCADRVEARHVQVIWLLAQGHTVRATSKVTVFGTHWIEQMLDRADAGSSRCWSATTRPALMPWPTDTGATAPNRAF